MHPVAKPPTRYQPALHIGFLVLVITVPSRAFPAQKPDPSKQDNVAEIHKPNLSGTWVDDEGREYRIIQRNDEITLRTQTGEKFESAKGVKNDRSFELRHLVNERTINPKIPEDLRYKVLSKQRVLIRGTLSEDGGTIRGDFINYEVEDDPSSSDVANPTEVKTHINLTLRRAIIYDVEVMDDQSKMFYPFKKGSQPNRRDTRTLFVIGKNLPRDKQDVEFVSHDPAISYLLTDIGEKTPSTNPLDRFKRGWERVLTGMKPEQQQHFRELDTILVEATLRKGVVPGHERFTLSGSEGDWVLQFADAKARIQFVRKTSENQFEDIENIYLPQKVALEVRSQLDLPLNEVALTVNNTNGLGQPVTVTATAVPGRTQVYRTPLIAILPKDEPPPASLEGTVHLEGLEGDQVLAKMEDQDELQAAPAAARIADDPGHLWLTALRKAAKCAGKSDEEALYARPEDPATSAGMPVENNGYSIKLGDHAAMLLLRDDFIKMMQSAEKNLASVSTNYGLLYGFRETLVSMKRDVNSPWSRIMVTGPTGEQTSMANAVNPQFLTANFRNTSDANAWSLNAISEGINNFRRSINSAVAEARGTDDCDYEKLLSLTGLGYDAVIAHVTPRLLKKQNGEWVPDTVARGWVNGLQTLASAVNAQQVLKKLWKTLGVGIVAAFAPFVVEAVLGSLAMHALNASFMVGGIALDIHEQVKVRERIELELGRSAVLGTGRLTEAELEKQPWGNVIRSALLQVGLMAGGSVAISELQKFASALDGAEVSTLVLQKGGKALVDLPKEQQAAFAAFAARAQILKDEGSVLGAAERRALLALDRLGQEASQAAAATNALPLVSTVSKVVEPGSANPSPKPLEPQAVAPSEPVSITERIPAPTEPQGVPKSLNEPAPTTKPRPPTEPKTANEPTLPPENPLTPEPPSKTRSEIPKPSKPELTREPRPEVSEPRPPEVPLEPRPAGEPQPSGNPPVDVNAPTVREPANSNARAVNEPLKSEPASAAPSQSGPKLPQSQPPAGPNEVTKRIPPPEKPTINPEEPFGKNPDPNVEKLDLPPELSPPTKKLPKPGLPPEPPPVTEKLLPPDLPPEPAPVTEKLPKPDLPPEPGSATENLPKPDLPPERVLITELSEDVKTAAGMDFQDAEGRVRKLGSYIGGGQTGAVFELADEPARAIKFKIEGDSVSTPNELVEDAAKASKLLADERIPQLKVIEHQAKGDHPYLIVEKKPANYETFNFNDFNGPVDREYLIRAGRWSEAHERAVVDLYDKMAAKGIVAEDLHIENIYFFRNSDGSLSAGVLDHDYIGKLSQLDPKLADRFARIAFRPNAANSNLESWLGQPLAQRAFPEEARFYMGKMLEHKRWIIFDVESGTFKPYRLDPKWVREKFPIDDWVYRVPKPQSRLLRFVLPWPESVARPMMRGFTGQWPCQVLAWA